jgi:hypothetical protein
VALPYGHKPNTQCCADCCADSCAVLPALQDLRDLFRLDPSECEASRTQRELHDMHAAQRRETPELTRHLAFLRTLGCYAGGLVGGSTDLRPSMAGRLTDWLVYKLAGRLLQPCNALFFLHGRQTAPGLVRILLLC